MIRSGEHAQWAASTVRARALVTLAIYTVVAEHLLVRRHPNGTPIGTQTPELVPDTIPTEWSDPS